MMFVMFYLLPKEKRTHAHEHVMRSSHEWIYTTISHQ